MKDIPSLPFPHKTSRRLMHLFFFAGKPLAKLFPSLSFELAELESDLSDAEYVSIAIATFLSYFALVAGLLCVVSLAAKKELTTALLSIVVLFALLISLSVLGIVVLYPKILLERKNNELESQLLFALRQLSIQASAGVPLFNALTSLTTGFGTVSKEFSEIVKDVEGGASFEGALEKSGFRNPSLHYRRVVWQLSNAVKAGASLPVVLNSTVDSLAEEQKILFKKFGSQLSPLALLYLLFTVIAPTLGLVFLMVLSSFSALAINEYFLAGILGALIILQWVFIGLISSRRPSITV